MKTQREVKTQKEVDFVRTQKEVDSQKEMEKGLAVTLEVSQFHGCTGSV